MARSSSRSSSAAQDASVTHGSSLISPEQDGSAAAPMAHARRIAGRRPAHQQGGAMRALPYPGLWRLALLVGAVLALAASVAGATTTRRAVVPASTAAPTI